MQRAWRLLSVVVLSGCAMMHGGSCPRPQAEVRDIQRLGLRTALIYGSSVGAESTVAHYGISRDVLDHSHPADVKQKAAIVELSDLDPRFSWYVELEAVNACGSTFTHVRRIPEP